MLFLARLHRNYTGILRLNFRKKHVLPSTKESPTPSDERHCLIVLDSLELTIYPILSAYNETIPQVGR